MPPKLLRIGGILLVAVLTLSAEAAVDMVSPTDHLTDGRVTLIYNPSDGNLSLETDGNLVTTLEVVSSSGNVFVATQPAQVLPPFDVYVPSKFFLLKTDGMGNTDFGPAMAANLTADFLAGDLTIDGSVAPMGALPNGGANLAVVPEPATLSLIGLGLLTTTAAVRRRIRRVL